MTRFAISFFMDFFITAVVVVMETEYGSGVGRSKKEAEQRAAAAAWNALDA